MRGNIDSKHRRTLTMTAEIRGRSGRSGRGARTAIGQTKRLNTRRTIGKPETEARTSQRVGSR